MKVALTAKQSTMLGYASLILLGLGNLARKIVAGEPVEITDILLLISTVLPSASRSKE